ncbi:MAG: FAD-dependent oxidoreductase [Actinomycetota bacterium]|nr:FAD-dependent oxidoreductase [Actinomycetota bacterium]
MATKNVVVVGGNFGGLTAAIAIKQDLGEEAAVTVVATEDRFIFNPSLIWLPFGKRSVGDVTFALDPTFDANGVHFVHATATQFDLKGQVVKTSAGDFSYDYLVIATGYRNDFSVADGLGPHGNAYTITTLGDAIEAGVGWRKFLEEPGNIVVGASQGAGCFGAAYEYLFNVSHQLRKAGLKKRVNLHFVTSEPFLGHFGVGGLPHGEGLLGVFIKKESITAHVNVAIDSVDEGRINLNNGTKIDFAYSMIVPPFIGAEVVANTTEISDAKGYVKVKETYQTEAYDNVYAVGIAAAVTAPWQTPTPVGIPKTGFPTERMAHVAAKNIASQIRGEEPTATEAFKDMAAICVMDAGNNGVVILADHMLPPRKHGLLIPGPQAHAMKLAFEKYFIWKVKYGHVSLP